MTVINIYNVCDKHKLGLGCGNHCHIINDCNACYKAMENTARTILQATKAKRKLN